ncbi:MAG TPA: hypothetical protein EYP14_03735 [Planctomycetaceae bacterium]|nr:hypothetical protein [Planctomycetaceae bacterium]
MESEHGRRGSEAIDTMALLTFNDLAGPDDPRSREVRTPWVGIMVPVHVHNLFSRHFVRNPPSKEGRMVEGDGRLHTQSTDHVFPRPQRPLTRNELLRALLDNDTVMAY